MRIALIPSAFAPRVGGVEVLTERLGSELQRRGHQIEIWTARSREDGLALDEVVDGLRIRRFLFDAPRASVGDAAAWPLRARATMRKLREAHAELDPHLLHVQCFSTNGAYATLLSLRTGTPLILTLHGETFMDDRNIYGTSVFLRTALRLGLHRARRVTACSRYTLEDVESRFGSVAKKSDVVFNGVELEEPAEGTWRSSFDRFVLALGRLVHRKGFDLLIQAWAQIANDHPDVGLVIGGVGEELPRLRDLVSTLGLAERVEFAGLMSRADVAAAMRDADVFAMPSRVEAFGIVALEAWQAGTPVVVTSAGGAAEFVEDGATGLVADPSDPAAFAYALTRLLSSRDLRAQLAEAASARVTAFGWSEITPRYERIYERAVNAS